MVDTQLLASIPLFADLDDDSLQQIARWFDPRSVSEGVVLAGEGASGYSFYVLREGGASVTHDGAVVAQLGPGDFFGESAIMGGGRRNATVTITEPSQVLVMFGTEFRRLQQLHPEIAAAIDDAAQQRLAAD
jgi:CRP-like cAMP-binding protein